MKKFDENFILIFIANNLSLFSPPSEYHASKQVSTQFRLPCDITVKDHSLADNVNVK